QRLADHPAVGRVVVGQPDQVQQGRPQVGFLDPGADGAGLRHRPGRVRIRRLVAGCRLRTVHTPDGYPRTDQRRPGHVDVRAVVAVVVGESVVDADVRSGRREEVVRLG